MTITNGDELIEGGYAEHGPPIEISTCLRHESPGHRCLPIRYRDRCGAPSAGAA